MCTYIDSHTMASQSSHGRYVQLQTSKNNYYYTHQFHELEIAYYTSMINSQNIILFFGCHKTDKLSCHITKERSTMVQNPLCKCIISTVCCICPALQAIFINISYLCQLFQSTDKVKHYSHSWYKWIELSLACLSLQVMSDYCRVLMHYNQNKPKPVFSKRIHKKLVPFQLGSQL